MSKTYTLRGLDDRAGDARTPIRTGREMSGLSQEQMAELLEVDVRTLRRYETGEIPTPNDLMLTVADMVKCPYLMQEHYKTKYHIGDDILPPAEVLSLSQAVVGLLNELARLEQQHIPTKLLDMAADGLISTTEERDFDWILSKLEGVRRAVDELRYCKREG